MSDKVDWPKIFTNAEEILKQNPEDCDASRRRAQAIGGLGNTEKAFESIEKHLKKHPQDAQAWDLRCAYLIDRRQYVEAIDSSNEAFNVNPDFHIGYYNRACAHALAGNHSAALSDLEEAIHFDEEFCEMAIKDENYTILKEDPRFRKLVRQAEGTNKQ